MKSRSCLIALLVLAGPQAPVFAQVVSDTLIAFGAGTIGSWATEYSLANKASAPISVYLGNTPEVPTACPPVTGCEPFAISILVPGDGSARSVGPALGFGTMHLKAMNSSTPPTVRARIVNTANRSQSADLPVFRLATLLALDPARLAFPGARKSGLTHSNLVLAVLRADGDFTPRRASAVLEVRSSSGELLASRQLDLEGGQTLFLIDVVGSLGVAELGEGQIRVIKTSGNGVIWGIMPTLNEDGSVLLSLGLNP